MSDHSLTPMSSAHIVDEYFAESRNRLLELAAFFDRLDRAPDRATGTRDFRAVALEGAAALLLQGGPGRVEKMLLLLSDTTEQPLEKLGRKGALGAFRSEGAD